MSFKCGTFLHHMQPLTQPRVETLAEGLETSRERGNRETPSPRVLGHMGQLQQRRRSGVVSPGRDKSSDSGPKASTWLPRVSRQEVGSPGWRA